MSSSCKILICLVQNACRKKCCLLIQHATFIFMFALIKYIFDCLWLLSLFFFFFFSYLFHLVDKHTGNLPLWFSDSLVQPLSPLSAALSLSQVLTFIFLKRWKERGKQNKIACKQHSRGEGAHRRCPEEGGGMASTWTRANKCLWPWAQAFQRTIKGGPHEHDPARLSVLSTFSSRDCEDLWPGCKNACSQVNFLFFHGSVTPWHALDRRGEHFSNGLPVDPPLSFLSSGRGKGNSVSSVPDPTKPPTSAKQSRNQRGHWTQKSLLYKDAKYMSMNPLSAEAAPS